MDTPGERRNTFTELLQRFRAGDSDAARELVQRYTPVIRHVVRERLPQRLRGEFESMDFAQEVWVAVCRSPAMENEFASAERLKEYLVRIAVNRVVDVYRHRSSQRAYSGSPEQPIEAAAGTDQTPSQFAIAGERWNSIAASLPTAHVVVVERVRQGFSHQEIAEQTGFSVRTISRIIQRVQRRCEEVPA